jgi:hypothetical protein
MISPYFISSVNDANAAIIYLSASLGMGSWNFFGGYFIPFKGSYIQIHNSTSDTSSLGPYNFVGCSGERLTGGDPTYGFKVTSAAFPFNIKGLNITGSRFDLVAGTSRYTFYMNNVILTTPNIVLQVPEAYVYAQALYYRANIRGGVFKVGREYEWVSPTLAGIWVNSFGSPYAPVQYMVDGEGIVHLQGRVSSGSGTIFTLPANFRPHSDLFITTGSNVLLLSASTGVMSLYSGSAPVTLNNISFKAGN